MRNENFFIVGTFVPRIENQTRLLEFFVSPHVYELFKLQKRVESIGQLPFWYEMGACQNLVDGNDETAMLCFSTAQYYNTCYR